MQAVEIDGDYYWDGMYSGNPAIYPLVYECESRDILLVHITPAERPGVPTTSPAIMNRMQEISSNTSLIREMRMIASYNKLIEQGRMGGGKRMLMHVIEAEEFIRAFSWSSRLNADWEFMQHLYNMGRARADQWLEANFDRLGIESTVDLDLDIFDCLMRVAGGTLAARRLASESSNRAQTSLTCLDAAILAILARGYSYRSIPMVIIRLMHRSLLWFWLRLVSQKNSADAMPRPSCGRVGQRSIWRPMKDLAKAFLHRLAWRDLMPREVPDCARG